MQNGIREKTSRSGLVNKIRLSVDDGCASDVKVAELAKKYDIETIFYWPVEWTSMAHFKNYEPLRFHDAQKIAQDFEIGSHTITHRHLTSIKESDAMVEIKDSQLILRKLFDQPIKKFCPPRGYTNESLTQYTMKFYDSQRLTRGNNLVHIHPNSGANNNRHWLNCITEGTEEIWCHSWELDKYDLWKELENYLENISS